MIKNQLIKNGYTIIEQLGSGAFGTAFLANEKGNKSDKVVIKEIDLLKLDKKGKNMVIQEGNILYQLEHKNIIKFIHFFLDKHENKAYIIMEFAEKGDLSKKIKELKEKKKLFKESNIITWFNEICEAVKYCHDNNIIHRDIKPANIFLTEDNHIKLGDFGISKILNSNELYTQSRCGTPIYMAPEVRNKQNYSFSCDIWSLGIVLYELCTLNYPFNLSSDLFNFIHYNNLNINDKFPQCYSQNIKILIQKMLKKEPKERPNINKVLEYIIAIKNINLMINEILSIKNNKYINIKIEGDSPLKNNVKKINQNLKNNFKRKRYLSCKKENIENEYDGKEEEEEEEEEKEENNNKKENFYKNNNKYDRNYYQKQKRECSAQKSKRLDIFSSTFLNNIEPNKKHKKIKMKSLNSKEVNKKKSSIFLFKRQLAANFYFTKIHWHCLRYDKGNNYIFNPYNNSKKNNNNFIDNYDKEFINESRSRHVYNIQNNFSRNLNNNNKNYKNDRLNSFQEIFFNNKYGFFDEI